MRYLRHKLKNAKPTPCFQLSKDKHWIQPKRSIVFKHQQIRAQALRKAHLLPSTLHGNKCRHSRPPLELCIGLVWEWGVPCPGMENGIPVPRTWLVILPWKSVCICCHFPLLGLPQRWSLAPAFRAFSPVYRAAAP